MPSLTEIIDFLEEKGSLELGASPWQPDTNDDQVEIINVDWKRLFGNKPEMDGDERDLSGDQSVFLLEDDRILSIIYDALESEIPSVFEDGKDQWDVCAWYKPIHFHGHDWGICIREECILDLAIKIAQYVEQQYSHRRIVDLVLTAAFCLYYLHELYHHKTECFGLRIHVVEGKSSYIPYMRFVYIPAKDTKHQLEESIANAFMYRNIGSSEFLKRLSKPVVDAARRYLDHSFPSNPPSYKEAPQYLSAEDFIRGESILKSQMQEVTLQPTRSHMEWKYAPRMNQSFFNIRSNIFTVLPRGQRTIIPSTSTPLKTFSTNDIVAYCEKKLDYSIVSGGKGSHIKMKKDNSPTITIPGGRPNLSEGVVKELRESLGLRRYKFRDFCSLILTKHGV